MEFPNQQNVATRNISNSATIAGAYDMRNHLNPRRMTFAMWDQAFLLRHQPGESFWDWERVLNETVERGYNTLRLDPMPQTLDLNQPDLELSWREHEGPFLPWDWVRPITLKAGRALIDFMQLASRYNFWFTLSAWWFKPADDMPMSTIVPRNTIEGAELWAKMLRGLQREVGLDRIVYVDLANEMPYFFPDFMAQLRALETGTESGHAITAGYNEAQCAWLRDNLDKPLKLLQREFPQLRFTYSIHGDPRWLGAGLTSWDCLDVHFYSDADPRWSARTGFQELTPNNRMYRDDSGYKAFSDACAATYKAIGPMLHARQRNIVRQFSAWSETMGMPLTCTEGWCSWFYIDHPDMDWGWLLDYSEHAIDDAIEFGLWGTTLNNYTQPQFEMWKDARWQRRLNERFLAS